MSDPVSDRPRPLHVAVVGLEFGAEFAPIYADHPDVRAVTLCDLDPAVRDTWARRMPEATVRDDLDRVLADPDVDAVHIVTGLDSHADHVIRTLGAGKHVACTVPMALSLEDIDRILAARDAAGLNYMMMETAAFTRDWFWAAELHAAGTFGTIAYARGTHFQDMTGWPEYWAGLPPMHYATHAVSPILRLLDARSATVRALGGGRLPESERARRGNPFPLESAIVELEGSAAIVELTRSLFQIARSYTESFSIYGDRASIEWPQLEASEHPVLFTIGEPNEGRGRPITAERMVPPDRADLLPEPLRRYTTRFVGEEEGHRSYVQGGGHGGSHPHLVHEFVRSIVEHRPPVVDHERAANWTATGIAAHTSAMAGGDPVAVPTFARPRSR